MQEAFIKDGRWPSRLPVNSTTAGISLKQIEEWNRAPWKLWKQKACMALLVTALYGPWRHSAYVKPYRLEYAETRLESAQESRSGPRKLFGESDELAA